MLSLESLPRLVEAFRVRQEDRDVRFDRITKVMSGDFSVFDPDEEEIESRSPNLIQVAAEDQAEAASGLPTVRVFPHGRSARAKARAEAQERVAVGYLEASDWERLIYETCLDLGPLGMSCWVVWPDLEDRVPKIERRDPRWVYPEEGLRPGERCRRVVVARRVFLSALPPEQQALVVADVGTVLDSPQWANFEVLLVEYFDEFEVLTAAMWDPSPMVQTPIAEWRPVELSRFVNRAGVCPVVIPAKITLDGEFRGQYDQVVDMLYAHVQLMGMILDYADQAVYSDMWVKDLIGKMPYGGGGYIELGANGAIGRVPPAVSSLDVQRDLGHLQDAIHLGARWPKSRPGEVDQAIASAKFVEATAGIMNTAIRTIHQIVRRALEQVLRVAFLTDVKMLGAGERVVSGTLRNQQFVEEYSPDDIDLRARVVVDYGVGFGRDPAQSTVLAIQYAQSELMSKETVQENLPGLTDVVQERARLDTEMFEALLKADLSQRVQSGQLPPEMLLELIRRREAGEPLTKVYREVVVDPAKEALAQSVDPGLGSGPLGPDGRPLPPGVAALGGAPGGGGPPPVPGAPDPVQILARLGSPAGPGGKLGSQVQG